MDLLMDYPLSALFVITLSAFVIMTLIKKSKGRTCKACGAKLPSNAKFCARCGEKIRD